MTQINNGGSAFPTAKVSINGEAATDGMEIYGPGMSLRDWFAGQALAGLMSATDSKGNWTSWNAASEAADAAYSAADAMLAARDGSALEAADAARAQGAEVEPTHRHYISRDNGTRMDGKRVTVLTENDETIAFKWEDSETPRHLGVEEFRRRFYLSPPAPQPTDREKVLEERLQAIIDWADLAMKNADEFDSHGVRNLDGPVFDAARAALASSEDGSASV